MTYDEVRLRFAYHAPNDVTQRIHEEVREKVLECAFLLDEIVEGASSREMSLFWTSLEEASFWLHAHIARNIGKEDL